MASASAQITNNCTVGGNLTVSGSLITTSFYANKPYIGFHCINNLLSATVFPGFAQSGITLSRTVAGTYTFTIPAHPTGANYIAFVQQQASSSATAIAICTVGLVSSTSFTVWSKSTTHVLADSNFFVYTVPCIVDNSIVK